MIALELADWVTGPLDVPTAVRDSAIRHLVDGFGTALAAARRRAAAPAVTVAKQLGGPEESTIIGGAARVGAPAAALANGTLVHALDFDDTHARGLVHATAVVLPAAFAVGQQLRATGREVLDAAVVGYEVVCRVGAAAPYRFQARGLHATMIGGVFSSAAVTSRLLDLSAKETAAALGIAGSQAGGLLAFLGTSASTKQLHPGMASHAGIIAARLAEAGASGPETVFDGPNGVFDALAGGEADPQTVVSGLGEAWETQQIGIKPHPICQLSHATIDAVGDALARRHFTPDEVVSIVADVHPDSAGVVCDTSRDLARPSSGYAAKFSLPWSVAAYITDGGLRLAAFDRAGLERPNVAELARKVSWTVTEPVGPAADARGHVRVILTDGEVVDGSVARSAGGPDCPLTMEELTAKATSIAGEPMAEVAELLKRLDELETCDPVLAAARA